MSRASDLVDRYKIKKKSEENSQNFDMESLTLTVKLCREFYELHKTTLTDLMVDMMHGVPVDEKAFLSSLELQKDLKLLGDFGEYLRTC